MNDLGSTTAASLEEALASDDMDLIWQTWMSLDIEGQRDAERRNRIIDALELGGRHDLVEQALSNLIDAMPDDIWIYVRHAQSAERRGDQALALERCRAIGSRFPNDAIGPLFEGHIRNAMGCAADAAACYSTAVARQPNFLWAHISFIESAIRMGEEEEALWRMRRAFEFLPSEPRIARMLAEALIIRGFNEEAQPPLAVCEMAGIIVNTDPDALYKAYRLQYPDYVWKCLKLIESEIERGDLSGACRRATEHRKRFPREPRFTELAISILQNIYAKEPNPTNLASLQDILSDAIKTLPENEVVLAAWADFPLLEGHYLISVRRWIDVTCRHSTYRYGRQRACMLLESMARTDDAELLLASYIAQAPHEPEGIIDLLEFLIRNFKWPEAVAQLPHLPFQKLSMGLSQRVAVTLFCALRHAHADAEVEAFFNYALGEPDYDQVGWIPVTVRFAAWSKSHSYQREDLCKRIFFRLDKFSGADTEAAHALGACRVIADLRFLSNGLTFTGSHQLHPRVSQIVQSVLPSLSEDLPSYPEPIAEATDQPLTVFPLDVELFGESRRFERLREDSSRLLRNLNVFCYDRRVRKFQFDLFTTGRFDLSYPIDPESYRFAGTVFLASEAAYAYRFLGNTGAIWLMTIGSANGHAIDSIYFESVNLIFVGNFAQSAGLSSVAQTQLRHIANIRSMRGEDRQSPPVAQKVVLVIGHMNFAHHMWNELPGLFEAERWGRSAVSEIAVVAEPFAPAEALFRWTAKLRTITTATQNLIGENAFTKDLLFTIGSIVVSEVTKLRLSAAALDAERVQAEAPSYRQPYRKSNRRVIWFSLRLMYRHAINLPEALLAILRILDGLNVPFDIFLDGFSLPADVDRTDRYDVAYLSEHREKVVRLGGHMVAMVGLESFRNVSIYDFTGANLPLSIAAARHVDYYFCHQGTQQHKIGWMYDIPGMIHGNPYFTALNAFEWPQIQADMTCMLQWLPSEFVEDAVTNNERQHLPDFRDYCFRNVSAMAEFVVSDICDKLRLEPVN